MSSSNKPDRDWHDPPSLAAIEGINPSVMEQQYSEGEFNPKSIPKWYRVSIIGITYLFTGIVIEFGLYLNQTMDTISIALVVCGVIMIGYSYYTRKKSIDVRVGE